MNILGLNAYHGDSSACLIREGQLISAVEEERFRRIKHWAGFPSESVKHCLNEANLDVRDLDHIAISRDPTANLPKKFLYGVKKRPSFSKIMDRLKVMFKAGSLRKEIATALDVSEDAVSAEIHNVEHHLAHLASTFLVSPFERAGILSIDAMGDFVSTMWGLGDANQIEPLQRVFYPHSTGYLYTAATQYLGFPRFGDEYKVMGLASYGEPKYLDEFRDILQLDQRGKFSLNLKYFRQDEGGVEMSWDDTAPEVGRMFTDEWEEVLGPARTADEPIEDRHKNIAHSLQHVLEETYFHCLNELFNQTGEKKLCLAGGVAYNSVANGKIYDNTPFEEIYIQPAAGDAGTALGAAYHVYHQVLDQPRNFEMTNSFWGPDYTNGEIQNALEQNDLVYERVEDRNTLVKQAANYVAEGNVIGWFQDRMEWGPRALGNRSIIADPRRADMRAVINERIKLRESFRPFAPSILEERTDDYFERSEPAPFMIKVYSVRPDKREEIPAVTHVDGTGRLQTVHRETNPLYWKLIKAFEDVTGVPVVLNTSFNENEPIVCTPQEAIDCFLRTKMDRLIVGEFVVEREESP